MKLAYLRISTKEQNFDGQQQEILKVHPDIDEFIFETSSGVVEKPELNLLLTKRLRPNDQLIVYSLNRISRNQAELLTLLKDLQEKQVTIHSIQEQFDFTTASGKLILGILSSFASFERENLLERQRAGIEAAKQQGKYKGKLWMPLENPEFFENCYQRYLHSKTFRLKNFMEVTGLKQSTLMRFLKVRKDLDEPFPNKNGVTLKFARDLVQQKNQVKDHKIKQET